MTAPIVKFNSLQLLSAIGNSLNWAIKMMDVKSMFFNSDLNEEIYMQQLEGFNDGTGQVLKLHWALYRLKQAGQVWHQHLHSILLNFRYISSADGCIFIKISRSNMEIISIYVDDLGLFANTREGMVQSKGELNESSQ